MELVIANGPDQTKIVQVMNKLKERKYFFVSHIIDSTPVSYAEDRPA